MKIDTNFKVYSDAGGGDPDSTSPTLRLYHKFLWSKPLPNGKSFELTDTQSGYYLYHRSELGDFSLSSDGIAHSYKNQERKKWLTTQIPDEVAELFEMASTIGAYTLFPRNMVAGQNTINQARGVDPAIDDRFDLTLECIRLFYLGQRSPLKDTLSRYKNFFDLFGSFAGYTSFFMFDDLVDKDQQVRFFLPFDNFKTNPTFTAVNDYLTYKRGVMEFVKSRNKRIEIYTNQPRNDEESRS